MVAVKEGMKALDFSLPDQDGTVRSLKDFKGQWLVLYFYPKDDTPGCTLEGIDFTRLLSEFHKVGTEVVGVSPDSGKSHCKFQAKHKLKVMLLSDVEKKTLREYGVWGKKKFMGREYEGVFRTTLLIDGKGVVRYVWENVKVEGHAKEVLEKVKDFS